MKLGTNIRHVSKHCQKGLQGQRSKVKATARQYALFRQKDSHQLTASRVGAERRCGVVAELFAK